MRSAWRGAHVHVRVAYARASLTGDGEERRIIKRAAGLPTTVESARQVCQPQLFHNGHPQVSFSHTQATRRKRCRTRATEVRVRRNDRPVGYTHTHTRRTRARAWCVSVWRSRSPLKDRLHTHARACAMKQGIYTAPRTARGTHTHTRRIRPFQLCVVDPALY